MFSGGTNPGNADMNNGGSAYFINFITELVGRAKSSHNRRTALDVSFSHVFLPLWFGPDPEGIHWDLEPHDLCIRLQADRRDRFPVHP